jgi:hypothetical protein
LYRVEHNIGIAEGMRYCLERATCDYVVPVDSDDVLSLDAFRRIASSLALKPQPAFVFSDEDTIDNGRLASPNRRAAFDPILNTCDSYIWHLCAFRRSKALELGAYSDTRAEYCHDWDTISRFSGAGERIQHIPHILYHWRTHAQSSSNSGSVNIRSLNSVKSVIERTIAKQKNPHLYEVGFFPISRGVDQYAMLRRPVMPMRICLLYLHGGGAGSGVPPHVLRRLGKTIHETRNADVDASCSQAELSALACGLGDIESEVVLVLTAEHQPTDAAGAWDAMLLFELHADVAAAAGRITDEDGRILSCCTRAAMDSSTSTSWVAGLRRTDPGPQALALKRQTATTITPGYFFCRTHILRETIEAFAGDATSSLAQCLAVTARTRGMRLAYSPLIEAVREPPEQSKGTGGAAHFSSVERNREAATH